MAHSLGTESDDLLHILTEDVNDVLAYPEMDIVRHIPSVDIYSTSEILSIEIEFPGVKKEDIDITFFNNTLIIKGVKYESFKRKKVNYLCMERSFGKLYRNVRIPYPVDATKISAVYKNGLLKLKIPKIREKRGGTRKIPVQSE